MTTATVSRAHLDSLLTAATVAKRERDSIDNCTGPEWIAAHRKARDLFLAANQERARLFKIDRWGAWMTRGDRALATITNSL